jgi:hypothetical protein
MKTPLTPEGAKQIAKALTLLCHMHQEHGNTLNSRFDCPGQPIV